MKKHILGLTIFAFIVGSFVSVFALFGYFTQTIPNVPKVDSENLPVFKADKKTSCFRQREKISYAVDNSVYFADSKTLSTTLKIKWSGYGDPPENLFIIPKVFTAAGKLIFSGEKVMKSSLFSNFRREIYTNITFDIPLDKNEFDDNLYTNLVITDEAGNTYNSNDSMLKHQVIFVHGESSIIDR